MKKIEKRLPAVLISTLFLIAPLLALLVVAPANVSATQTATLSPLADCKVNQDQPTTNYGNAENWEVTTKWPNDNTRVYLKFDMSSLSPTTIVQLATLRLYCFYAYWLSPPDTNVEARRVSDDTWTQNGLTWNNQPGGGVIEASLAPAVGQWNEWNVTSYVQDELPSDSILGLVLGSQTENLDEYYHYSRYYSQREVGYPALRPQLYIEYTMPAPIITSTAPTGAWEDHAYSYSPTCDQAITTWGLTTNASWLSQNGATGEVSGTPDNTNSTKSYSVSISAENANGTGYQNYTVTVANNIPTITTTPGSNVWTTKKFYYNISATDWGAYGGTFGASITTNWTGTYNWTPSTGNFDFVPNVKGSFWFVITFNDNSGAGNATISQNFTVTVAKPYVTSIGLTGAWEDHAYSYTPTVNTTVTSWGHTTNGSWVNQNSSTGEIYGTPTNTYSEQSYWVNISAVTQFDGTVYQNYSIFVHNYVPHFTSTPDTLVYLATTYSYTANFDDKSVGGSFSGIATNYTHLYSFTLSTGFLTFSANSLGLYWFNITADDQTGASNATSWQNFTITIAKKVPPSTGILVAKFNYMVHGSTANFTDISQGTGIITWHWDFGDGHESATQDPEHIYSEIGNYSVVLTVVDAAGHTSSAQKIITVSSVSSQPMIPGAWAWIIPLSLLGSGVAGIARSRNPFIQSVCAVLVAIVLVVLLLWS